MQIIELEGYNIAVGMDWPYSNGEPEAEASELDAKGYIPLSNDVNSVVGIANELPKKNVLYAFAALCLAYLDNTSRHAAFVVELPQKKIAFVGILDGLPISNYDKIVNAESLHDTLDKFIQDAGATGVAVYTNIVQLVNEYSEIASGINIEDMLEPLAEKKFAESVKVKKLTGSIWPWVIWIVLLVGAAGFMGWKLYQEQQMAAEAARLASEDKTPQQRYDESLPEAYSKAGWDLQEALRVLDTIADKELSRGGWNADLIVCSQARAGCEVTWKKKDVAATYATFAYAALATTESNPTFYKQDSIIESVAMTTRPMRGWKTIDLGEKTVIYNNQLSMLQRLAATGDAQVSFRDPAPYATNGQTIPAPAYQGGITFTGDAYLLPMLSRIDGSFISVSEIELGFAGTDPTFKVEFNYYTRQP